MLEAVIPELSRNLLEYISSEVAIHFSVTWWHWRPISKYKSRFQLMSYLCRGIKPLSMSASSFIHLLVPVVQRGVTPGGDGYSNMLLPVLHMVV